MHVESWFWCWCVMQIELFIHTAMESYIPVTHKPLRRGLIKTSNVGSFPQSRVMRAEQATFACTLEPLFILKHVLQGITVALIVWSKGPSFPRVWYNEGERTTHDLQLSQTRYLKQPGPETEQQHWFVPTHGPAPSGPADLLRVMWVPESVHSRPAIQPNYFLDVQKKQTLNEHICGLHCICLRCFFSIFRHYLLENLIT